MGTRENLVVLVGNLLHLYYWWCCCVGDVIFVVSAM